jgi:hypothetical protein
MGDSMLRSGCCRFGIFLIALSSGIGACPVQGQTISFFRQFTTPAIDRAGDTAADTSGIYVIGNRPAAGGSSAGLRKYD